MSVIIDQLRRFIKERQASEQKMENKKCQQRCKNATAGTYTFCPFFPHLLAEKDLDLELSVQ